MAENLQLPQPPPLFPEKLRNIDAAGCEQVQRSVLDWWRKVTNKLRGDNPKLPDAPVLFTDAATQATFESFWEKVVNELGK